MSMKNMEGGAMTPYQQGMIHWVDCCNVCGKPEPQPHHHSGADPEVILQELRRLQPPIPDDVLVVTPARLAALWGMPVQKIRELCRDGRIPGRKLGPKEWCIPVAALRQWALQNPTAAPVPEVNVVARARPHRVEVHHHRNEKGTGR